MFFLLDRKGPLRCDRLGTVVSFSKFWAFTVLPGVFGTAPKAANLIWPTLRSSFFLGSQRHAHFSHTAWSKTTEIHELIGGWTTVRPKVV